MKSIFLLATFFLTESCFAHPVGNNKPPELWSWFKDLEKSVKACEIQSSFILQNLHFENRTENQYGIYATYRDNSIVVKCIEVGEKSKLWVAVAGSDRDSVEALRNMIIKEIN